MLFKKQYLTWREQFTLDLVVSSALCLGERVLERILFPGLHRSAARAVTEDPARVDSISVLIADAVALFLLLWVFYLTLYAISYLTRRPLKSYAPTLVAGILLTIIFVSSMSEWFRMPNPATG
ncbi:MAG: hypothetical protein ACRECO_00775 [Xanthobacteraceae bacterium]